MKASKEKVELIILLCVGLIVIAFLGSTYFVGPMLQKKKVLLQQYLDMSQQIKQNERIAKSRKNIEENVKDLTQQLNQSKEQIPKVSGSFSLLSILNEKAQEAGVIFERIEPREIEEKLDLPRQFTQKEYVLHFSAGFHQLGHFINLLENTSPFIQIQEVRIQRRVGDDKKHDIQVRLHCLMEERT